ncbi:hypothetical protein AC578_4036 [Pseudocercospora eumusae]|uniref:Uncharacterized protein n=1 Tax=Pseudocercospora eumusae TaxID=321146 RepID=A0A139HE25_9PEZI|nr:hypothetical protein AC578_4036 [Pseudocercospora eumusae]
MYPVLSRLEILLVSRQCRLRRDPTRRTQMRYHSQKWVVLVGYLPLFTSNGRRDLDLILLSAARHLGRAPNGKPDEEGSCVAKARMSSKDSRQAVDFGSDWRELDVAFAGPAKDDGSADRRKLEEVYLVGGERGRVSDARISSSADSIPGQAVAGFGAGLRVPGSASAIRAEDDDSVGRREPEEVEEVEGRAARASSSALSACVRIRSGSLSFPVESESKSLSPCVV